MADDISPASNGEAKSKEFTPSDHIAELNGIDKSISDLLSSASEAIGILSNDAEVVPSAPRTLASAQARFTQASSTYFATLSDIEVRLRRQVYALEEAGLIEPGEEKDAKAGRALGASSTGRGGVGPLDPSWLNARADNGVDFAMRKGLVSQTKDFLERMKTEGHLQGASEPEDRNVDMKDDT